MPSYNFRLRFNFPSAYHINSDADKFELLTLSSGEYLTLHSGGANSPIKAHHTAAVIGGPYASSELASVATLQSKRSLLYWAVEYRVGIDFGDGRQRSVVTNFALDWYDKQLGIPCRNDIHGIDIYEAIEGLRFVGFSAEANVGKNPLQLRTTFQREYLTNRQFTEKQVLASEIYASSFFDVSPRARFITLVTAIEALLDSPLRSEETQKLVAEFMSTATDSQIDEDTKNSLISSLGMLKHQSIGQAGRRLVSQLIPYEVFDGQSSADFFDRCYHFRSQILHQGTIEDRSVDVWSLANLMEPFVHRVLIASLNNQSQTTLK
jgi:hypothetical protein